MSVNAWMVIMIMGILYVKSVQISAQLVLQKLHALVLHYLFYKIL